MVGSDFKHSRAGYKKKKTKETEWIWEESGGECTHTDYLCSLHSSDQGPLTE